MSKFHVLGYIGEDIGNFESKKYLDDRAFKIFIIAIKRPFRTPFMKKSTRIGETVNIMGHVSELIFI